MDSDLSNTSPPCAATIASDLFNHSSSRPSSSTMSSVHSRSSDKDLEFDASHELIDRPLESERPDKLKRGLSPRQTQMIAVGGIIGSGYFIGTGAALATGGPVGLLLGYAIMGLVTFSVIVTLGESKLESVSGSVCEV